MALVRKADLKRKDRYELSQDSVGRLHEWIKPSTHRSIFNSRCERSESRWRDADKINVVENAPEDFRRTRQTTTSRSSDKTAANRLFLRYAACDVDRATATAAVAQGAYDQGESVRSNWRSDPFSPSALALISFMNDTNVIILLSESS